MTSARDEILTRIRRSLRRTGPLDDSIAEALETRLARHEAHVQPAVEDADLVARFAEKLGATGATVERVPGTQAVPAALSAYLEKHAIPPKVVMATDEYLGKITWPGDLGIDHRAAAGDDRASLTSALAAVAESGTLVLPGGPDHPTTLNFLPDDHIVVLPASKLVRHLEDLWTTLREARPDMPRTVNLVTGPSKTADVEQTLQQGAHGPRRLHVIVVEDQ